jgi:hypothetical protein
MLYVRLVRSLLLQSVFFTKTLFFAVKVCDLEDILHEVSETTVVLTGDGSSDSDDMVPILSNSEFGRKVFGLIFMIVEWGMVIEIVKKHFETVVNIIIALNATKSNKIYKQMRKFKISISF